MTHTASHKATDCTLVLFTKRPRPGVGKQRIAAETDAAFAFELAERLFSCAAEDLLAWPGPRVICVDRTDDVDWAARQCPGVRVVVQGPGNLGARLQRATEDLTEGSAPILFIGSDAPTVDTTYLLEAANALSTHDVVLGAAADGGVVAMGTRAGWPELEPLPWSTATLGAELATACEARGWRVQWLGAHTDIDTPNALDAVMGTLALDGRPARRSLVAWLQRARHELEARHIA
ncbi:MAG: DUF2064 domain-containing protein [Pseudomonadota bacterium]